MKREEILNAVRNLAFSKGFYGRLYNFLTSEDGEQMLDEMAEQHFGDVVDMVIWLEE